MAESSESDEEEEDEQILEEDEKKKEFIFLIDRSYSMTYTIELARQALVLFLHSLPADSHFNVCSYGSRFEFMFQGDRSVPYNDANLKEAIDQVKGFVADFGGTEIYRPMEYIFSLGKPRNCEETHIFLLTDGAVFNTTDVIKLVQQNANLQ